MPDPDDLDGDPLDPLDQPGALERTAGILGVPTETLARLAAELAAMPDPMADLVAQLGPDPLLAELAALPAPEVPTAAELAAWDDADAELVRQVIDADAALLRELASVLDPEDLPDVLGLDPDDGGQPC
jgi:hypothetical protein